MAPNEIVSNFSWGHCHFDGSRCFVSGCVCVLRGGKLETATELKTERTTRSSWKNNRWENYGRKVGQSFFINEKGNVVGKRGEEFQGKPPRRLGQ